MKQDLFTLHAYVALGFAMYMPFYAVDQKLFGKACCPQLEKSWLRLAVWLKQGACIYL